MTTYIEPFLGGAVALSLLPSSPKPFLRWPGGKRKLAADVVEMLGDDVKAASHMLLTDVNEPLMALWRAVRDDSETLLAELRSLPRSPEGYLKVRSDSNAKTTPATTLYLNLFAFNGLQRVNSKGHNNVPCDAVRLAKLDLDAVARNVLEVSRSLRQRPVDIAAADFEAAISQASSGDFVYCDPPYIGTFTSYSRKRFGVDEHVKLWQAAVAATMRGARVVISNSAAALPMYEELARSYGLGFVVKHVTARRSIAAKSSSRGDVGEVMVSPRLR